MRRWHINSIDYSNHFTTYMYICARIHPNLYGGEKQREDRESDRLGFQSYIYLYSLDVWIWASCLTSLSLNFPSSIMWIMCLPHRIIGTINKLIKGGTSPSPGTYSHYLIIVIVIASTEPSALKICANTWLSNWAMVSHPPSSSIRHWLHRVILSPILLLDQGLVSTEEVTYAHRRWAGAQQDQQV